MARTGRFGRLPRTAPDISATIMALVREYQAARERNIVDAWKNGGTFEGKKATDEMLLKFFDDKLKGLDPNDPVYTEAKNTAGQYRFAVKNSKQELLYAQGKVSDGAMAAFYRREAGVHPRNSEVYRQLMKLAAQYHDRAASAGGRGGGGGGGRGGGRGGSSRESKAARDARIETPRGSELAWKTVTNYLLDLARRQGIVNSGQSVESATETTGEGFGDLQVWQGDFSATKELINAFATSPEFAADRAALTEYIQKYGDKNFDGNYTLQGILNMRNSARAGLSARLADAQRNGTKTQIKAITKELVITTKAGSALSVIDPMTVYEEARETWETIIGDPKSSPLDKWEATQSYRQQVGEVWEQLDQMAAALGGDDGGWSSTHAGRALSEWRALGGDAENVGPTLWEESRGQVVGLGGAKENSDAWTTAQEQLNLQNQLALLGDGSGEYVIARVDSAGQPTQGADYEMAVVAKSTLAASGIPVAYMGAGNSTVDAFDENGKPIKIDTSAALEAVYGQPLIAKPVGGVVNGKPTRDNFTALPGTQPTLGAVFTYPDGSTVWQVVDEQGTKRFTTVPPFADDLGATLSADGQGNVVVSWVADPGQARTTFNPNDVLDPIYTDPELVGVQKNTVFMSAYMAHSAQERNALGGLLRTAGDDEKVVRSALAAESGGDPNVFSALMSEAQQFNAMRAASIERQDAVRDDAFAFAKYEEASRRNESIAEVNARFPKPEEFNKRALELLVSTGNTSAIPGYEEMKRTPGSDLSAYIKEWVGDAAGDLVKQRSYIGPNGEQIVGDRPYAPPPTQRDTDRVGSIASVRPSIKPPPIIGYKDDGRPVYGGPTIPTAPVAGAPGAYRPPAPPPAPVYKRTPYANQSAAETQRLADLSKDVDWDVFKSNPLPTAPKPTTTVKRAGGYLS